MKQLRSALSAMLVSIAALALFCLMMVTAIDVGGRSLFNAPLLGSYELSEICIGIVVSAALPIITLQNEHIRLNLTDRFFGGAGGMVRDFVVAVLMSVACGVLAWRLWLEARSAVVLGASTDTLHLPKAPVIGFIAVMFLLAGVAAIGGFLERGWRAPEHSTSERTMMGADYHE